MALMGRSQPTAIAARRLRVAEFLAANPGLSVRQLAPLVGCSPATICRDLIVIRAEWAERRRDLYEERAAEDLARTDAMIAVLWPGVLAGDGRAIDRVLALLHYRADVLGLKRPGAAAGVDLGEVLATLLARQAAANATMT
jgi:hypothetical protein